jgi:beta-lactamase class A
MPRTSITIISLLATVVFLLNASGPARADSPDGGLTLREAFDPGLQEELEEALATLGLASAVEEGKLAVALADISDPEDPRVASVNGDRMFYAASLPKIAILLAAFVEIERGEMVLDGATRETLTRMTRHSSNQAATAMLRRVGKERLLQILRSDRFRLYDPQVNGGLWVGKEYGKSPAYRRDPLHNLSHAATAMQAARFYYLLETGQLASPRLTREMKEILSRPGISHKFVKGLADFPAARVYRKSGTWRRWHADSALVEEGRHRYILVGLAEDPAGGRWLTELAAPLHRLIVSTSLARRGE